MTKAFIACLVRRIALVEDSDTWKLLTLSDQIKLLRLRMTTQIRKRQARLSPTEQPAFNAKTDLPLATFLAQMWSYAFTVLYPAQALKSMGRYRGKSIGAYPRVVLFEGEGRYFSCKLSHPAYLKSETDNALSVKEFDRGAKLYRTCVAPFTQPVYEETINLMRPFLVPDARILDTSCGPGAELVQMAEMVPEGEIVGTDLSAGMISQAFASAKRRGLHNTAFYQADVNRLPRNFTDRFDAVYCSFAFHHYQDPIRALASMRRVLNRRGKAFVVDPGAWWFNALSAPLAKWADPGWVRFHTGAEFKALFRKAGFTKFYWEEILPGIGLSIGSN
jgi:SAM-dependent methyltransferase